MEFVALSEVSTLPEIKPQTAASTVATLPHARPMRIGAYTVDAQTSTIRWRGEVLPLTSEQRQTLHMLLKHAGQILSCERLGALLRVRGDTIDSRMRSLRSALESLGVTWVPRRAEGCGYILWR